jgi:hypothetical protein
MQVTYCCCFGQKPPLTKNFYLTHSFESKGKNLAMYGQLDLEEISERCKSLERVPNYYELGMRNLIIKNNPK